MAKSYFRLSFKVATAEKLATVIQLLAREVQDIRVEELLCDAPAPRERPANPPSNSGVHPLPKDSLCEKTILKAFAPGSRFSVQEAGAALVAIGLKTSSASPSLSRLCRRGLVQRVGANSYHRVK